MPVPSYIQASIPDIQTIMWLDMKPFTLGHWMLLTYYQCAFADPNNNLGLDIERLTEQLILGLAICHRTYDEFNEWFASPDWHKWVEAYGQFIAERRKMDKSFDIYSKIKSFKCYVENGSKPPYATIPKNGSKSGMDWTGVVMDVMTSKCGYAEKEVLNDIPLTKVLFHFYKYLENQGVLRIQPDGLC